MYRPDTQIYVATLVMRAASSILQKWFPKIHLNYCLHISARCKLQFLQRCFYTTVYVIQVLL